jgi:hypothetical protein
LFAELKLDRRQLAPKQLMPQPNATGVDDIALTVVGSDIDAGQHADFRAIEHATGSKILVARNLGLATQVVAAPQLLHGGLPLVGA